MCRFRPNQTNCGHRRTGTETDSLVDAGGAYVDFENPKEKIGYKTIGVRIPDCSTARELLLKNGPMLTTSVNDSGSLPMNQYEDILKRYRDLVDEIYPPEPSSAVASTVVLLKDGTAEILREGTIKKETIIELLNA